jgi:hypothetical protein
MYNVPPLVAQIYMKYCSSKGLKGYNLSIIRNDESVFFSKNLNELNNLYTYHYMEEILMSE